ncbi:transcriptional regulator [Streptomyces violaceus]|nr:transcriptional regulator [Streptomyces janthinus]
MLVRTQGGAAVHGVSYELPLRYKTARHASEKQRIAKAVADPVAPGEAVGLTGGVARAQSYEPVGPLADGVLGQITVEVAVLGVVAFDVTHGAAAHDEAEAAINRLLCERAERVVVAADSSKLGQRGFARICAAEAVDTLVTDTTADAETLRRFEEAGLRVVTV